LGGVKPHVSSKFQQFLLAMNHRRNYTGGNDW
jgi:hypothetical protein